MASARPRVGDYVPSAQGVGATVKVGSTVGWSLEEGAREMHGCAASSCPVMTAVPRRSDRAPGFDNPRSVNLAIQLAMSTVEDYCDQDQPLVP